MKKKINFYLMTVSIIAIAATMLLVSLICYGVFKKQIMEDMKTYAYLIKNTNALDEMMEMQHNLKSDTLRITVVDANGDVLFESNADEDKMENHSTRPEIVQALADGEGQAIRKSATLDKNAFYYAVRTDAGNVLRIAKEADSIFSIFADAFPAIVAIGVVLILLCLLSVHFLTKSLLRPIEKIAQNVDNLEELDTYDELVPFIYTIRKQHEDIIRNAGIRQEFTANVSHELKTPLTSISGYAELIENGMASEEDIARFAKEIHRNSNRLLTLINDVIRLSELDVADRDEPLEHIDLYEIAETCVSMLQINADNNNVTLTLEGERSIVNSTRQMMEELLYNLCDNAIRYNKKGGRVTVVVGKSDIEAVLMVKDTGIGIPREHQERIFERFYRVDKSRSKSTGGTGLGLAIVKHIVAKNNARIEIVSESGRGTKITVFLPRA